ncbi:MAG: hypothetical protein P4K93_02630 [Terracidiphilus sp.]|nr:hypothetical protein [Terracidiphilus sp.]
MNERDHFDLPRSFDSVDQNDQDPAASRATAPRPRAVGSPLSTGMSRHASYPSAEGVKRLTPPPPGRALGGAPAAAEESSSVQRAVSMLRNALPFVQRLLPLLDGNIATTVSSLLSPRHHPQAPPSAKLDLVPIEDGLAELQTQHQNLRDQVMEQNTSLKRVEDQLEMVREATDRNTLEQQELLEDLKAFGNKVKFVVVIALLLVAVGFVMTLALFLHMQRVLP